MLAGYEYVNITRNDVTLQPPFLPCVLCSGKWWWPMGLTEVYNCCWWTWPKETKSKYNLDVWCLLLARPSQTEESYMSTGQLLTFWHSINNTADWDEDPLGYESQLAYVDSRKWKGKQLLISTERRLYHPHVGLSKFMLFFLKKHLRGSMHNHVCSERGQDWNLFSSFKF
jgi:hypothetical protein